MLRRHFLSSFMAAIIGAPQSARSGDTPERMTSGCDEPHGRSNAAQRRQLSRRVEQLSREVEILTRELADADAHRTQILTLVHAMRCPLASVHLRAELMMFTRGGISDELHRHLDMSAGECGSLAELINDVFGVERRWRERASRRRLPA